MWQTMPTFAFFDESGLYDFNPRSGSFLVYTGIITARPVVLTNELTELKYRLLGNGRCIERFHAYEDGPQVQAEVFGLIQEHMNDIAIHSVVVRKNRVNPVLHKYGVYSQAYKTLLRYLAGGPRGRVQQLHIIVDTPPDPRQKKALKAALRAKADEVLDPAGITHTIDHHNSAAHTLLQVADYCAWAIYRKWQTGDRRFYDLIRPRIVNEYDIFAKGDRNYY
jgi:hypothetical protein